MLHKYRSLLELSSVEGRQVSPEVVPSRIRCSLPTPGQGAVNETTPLQLETHSPVVRPPSAWLYSAAHRCQVCEHLSPRTLTVTVWFNEDQFEKVNVQNSLHDEDVSSVHEYQHQTLPPDENGNQGWGMKLIRVPTHFITRSKTCDHVQIFTGTLNACNKQYCVILLRGNRMSNLPDYLLIVDEL